MSDQTRVRIVQASGPIFASYGYEAATVRQICDAAEVNHASINYYFGGKQSLYLETVKLAHQTRLADFPPPEWPPETPPREQLGLFVRAMLSRMLEPSETSWPVRLLMREMIEPTGACQAIVEDFIRPQFQQLIGILREMLPGPVPEYHYLQLAFSIIGQCLHYRVAAEFVALLVPPEEHVAHFGVDELARHITGFSVAALDSLSLDSSHAPTRHAPGTVKEAVG